VRAWPILLLCACARGPVTVELGDAGVGADAAPGDAEPQADPDAAAGDSGAALDGGKDAATDGGADAATDGGSDAASDAGADAAIDGGLDAGSDAGADAGLDAGMLGDFGAAGFVLGPAAGFAGGGGDQLFGVAVDSSQRVIAVGSCLDLNGGRHALLVRHDSTGALDPSFDGDGFIVDPSLGDQLRHVAIDPQSRIVVAGERADAEGRTWTLLARYLEDGRLDASFGSGGFVIGRGAAQSDAPFSGYTAFPDELFRKVHLDSAGRIVAAGVASETNQDWFYRTLVARFTSAGALDAAFGGSGFAVGDGSGGNWYTGPHDELFSFALTDSDEVRAVGWTADPTYAVERTLLAAFTSAGVLSSSFNQGATPGFYMGDVNAWAGGTKQVSTDVAVDPQGNVITTGFSFDANNVIFAYVERYLAGGARDAAFGAGGFVLARPSATGSAAEYPFAVAIDGQGRIVVGGFTDDGGTGGIDRAFLYRYTAAGQLDTSFNPTGAPIAGAIESWTGGVSELAGGTEDAFNDIAVAAGDRIYAVGTSNGRTVVARYREDGCLDAAGCAN
jgi:uncharacterized delta-60 repeat protein